MIKKLIGMLFAAATLGVIVFTVLGRDRYRSLIARQGGEVPQFMGSRPVQEPEPEAEPYEEPAGSTSGITSPDEYFEEGDDLPSDLFADDDITL
ncbi:MAG: hypothetical protein K2L09_05910 [Alistipes sp.]|nr:hypothetical protein [Alistipes sp.]